MAPTTRRRAVAATLGGLLLAYAGAAGTPAEASHCRGSHRNDPACRQAAPTATATAAPAVPTPTTMLPVASTVLWRADHEEGDLSDWYANSGGGEFNSGNGDTTPATFDGRRVARQAMAMDGASNNGTRMFRWHEADRYPEAYYSTWVYFPQRYSVGGWWNFFQFKSKSADGSKNDAFWQLNIRHRADGSMYLAPYNWISGRWHAQDIAGLPVGRWVHVEAFLKQSDADAGRLTVWQDGVQIVDLPNITTKYPGGRQDWSVNAYGDGISPSPIVTYIDDAAIGTARIGPGGGG